MEEECEREEGEACFGKDEDACCIDPDVDLSYIDEKLQDVLGHLQIEFEGGVSVENLGAKFGGYGSFLPSYKRSPSILSQPGSPPKVPGPSILFQPGSPPKDPGRTVVSSPHGLSCEGTCNDLSIQINASVSKNSSTLIKGSDLGGSARKDVSTTATTTRNHIEDNGLINKRTKGFIQSTLKVRIKVGPDNISARNNAAIYSGLGLELSPSSSLDDSPEGIKGVLEQDGIPNESPRAILAIMTDFPILEGCFLSPLQENLLRFTEAGDHVSENHRGDLPGKSILESISISGQLNAPLRSTESCRETTVKPLPENIQIGGLKSKLNDDTSVILEKKVDVETPEGQKLTFQTSSTPLLLNSGTAESKIMVRKVFSKIQDDSVKITKKIIDQQTESNRMLLNEKTFHSGVGKRNTFESKRSIENDGIVSLKEEAVSIKGKPSPIISLIKGDSVKKNMICGKNALSCMQKECMEKPENSINLNEGDLDGPKVYKDRIFGTNEFIKLNGAQKTDKLPEINGKLKATAANVTSVTDPQKKSMVSLSLLSGKEEKKFHAWGDPAENKSKRLKSPKESLHDYPKQSQSEIAWEGKDGLVVGRTELMVTPLIAKNRTRDIKIAKKKSRVRSVVNKSVTPLSFEAAPIEACMDALICDHSASDAVVAPGATVIKDNWACCDICEKWRLLPNGTNPADLPKKWTCSMQFWLAVGMNNCSISEAETTKIMNPQCHISFLESNSNHDYSAPSTSSVAAYVNQVTHEIGSIINTDYNQVRRLSDTSMERQKQKFKGNGKSFRCSSDGVDIKRGKDSKSISKGLINADISGANKMINPDGFHLLNNDGKLSPDLSAKVAPYLTNGSSAVDLTGKMGDIGDKFLSNSMRDLKCGCSSLNGTMKPHLGIHTGQEFKQVSVIDAQMSNNSVIPVKKRKAREWHDIQNNHETAMRSQHLGGKRIVLGKDTMDKLHDKTSITSRIGGKAKGGIPSSMLCRGVRGNALPSEVGEINVVNSVSTIPDQHDKHLIELPYKKPFQNEDKLNETAGNDEDIASSHCGDRTVISESCKRVCFRDRSKISECEFNKGKTKLSNIFSEQEELHFLRNGKQGTPNQGPHLMSNVKAKGLEVCPTGETVRGFLELDQLVKASDNKNLAHHGSLRRENVNELSGQRPMRKCAASNAALAAMKEAKELKHAADRMKNLGQELEGTALYFQAALKFLQAAFLSEPSSVVNIKYEELNESLKTYTQTAALCEFCAREYEKRKDMVFAALAYKCMEVAYFKVAFFKNHIASKDHNELQATIQTFSQGDSPSSSASDLDNLNQLGAIEKVTYSKVVNSLQFACSHVIASRPSFTRWLDYTNVSISALEASRKSQNALSVASANLEKNGCDSIASVEDALDFNFHNVEELLRRIRAAMESFNH